jgi:hypothetical protein
LVTQIQASLVAVLREAVAVVVLWYCGTTYYSKHLGISQSSGINGFLSGANFTIFNNKVGGSGTLNFVPKWATTGTIGNSQII